MKEVLKRRSKHEVIGMQLVRSECVSTLAQKRRTVGCPRCHGTMSEVVRIDPLYEQPGLIAYECNDCHYVTSEIVPAETGEALLLLDDAHHAERRAARQGACRGPENPPRQAAQRKIRFRELPCRFGARPIDEGLWLLSTAGGSTNAPRPDAGDADLPPTQPRERVDDQAHHSICDCPVGSTRGLTPPSWSPRAYRPM